MDTFSGLVTYLVDLVDYLVGRYILVFNYSGLSIYVENVSFIKQCIISSPHVETFLVNHDNNCISFHMVYVP